MDFLDYIFKKKKLKKTLNFLKEHQKWETILFQQCEKHFMLFSLLIYIRLCSILFY